MTSLTQFREALLDNALAKALAFEYAERAHARFHAESGGEFADAFLAFTKEKINHAVDIIFQYGESEIEKLFLGTVALCFAMTDPLRFVFSSPLSNAQTQMTQFRQQIDAIEALRKGPLSESQRAQIRELDIDRALGRFDSFYISMQSSFPDIRVDGRSIRVDAFIWIPSNPHFKLVVECDGYQFHSNRERFVADRKRDRELKRRGIEVFRFSGSEIYNRPIECGGELFRYLTGESASGEPNQVS